MSSFYILTDGNKKVQIGEAAKWQDYDYKKMDTEHIIFQIIIVFIFQLLLLLLLHGWIQGTYYIFYCLLFCCEELGCFS